MAPPVAGLELAAWRTLAFREHAMGIFDQLKQAIFGKATASGSTPSGQAGGPMPAAQTPNVAAAGSASASSASPSSRGGAAAGASPAGSSAPGSSQAGPSTGAATSGTQQVDVEAVLQGMAARKPEKLNWQSSIVDLMKLVDLDPSLENRKALATELGYQGDAKDSATLNVWLHHRVMEELAAAGGKVPDDLRHH